MIEDTPAPTVDALIIHIEECLSDRKCITKNKLEFMRSLAIDAFNQFDRLHTLYAYAERDNRETFKTIKMLEESGLIDEGHFSTANMLVTEARSPTNRYTDVDTIKHRNIKTYNEEGE